MVLAGIKRSPTRLTSYYDCKHRLRHFSPCQLDAYSKVYITANFQCGVPKSTGTVIYTLLSGFYHLRSLHRLLIPRHALIISQMFLYSARQGRVPYHTARNTYSNLTRVIKKPPSFLVRLPFINFLDTFYLCPDSL